MSILRNIKPRNFLLVVVMIAMVISPFVIVRMNDNLTEIEGVTIDDWFVIASIADFDTLPRQGCLVSRETLNKTISQHTQIMAAEVLRRLRMDDFSVPSWIFDQCSKGLFSLGLRNNSESILWKRRSAISLMKVMRFQAIALDSEIVALQLQRPYDGTLRDALKLIDRAKRDLSKDLDEPEQTHPAVP